MLSDEEMQKPLSSVERELAEKLYRIAHADFVETGLVPVERMIKVLEPVVVGFSKHKSYGEFVNSPEWLGTKDETVEQE